tara:strand:+ start:73 stop:636 length:564 start_codon:yes stop_codon:yes gene_type:complete
MEYSVDEKQIQRDLQNLIDKGGLNKKYAKLAAQSAADVVDTEARKGYKNAQYRFGSSKTHRFGNFLTPAGGPVYSPRAQWRKWASKRGSIKFDRKKQQKTQFWFRSMVKRINNGRGNPSTLSHLIEDGAKHFRTGRKTFAHQIRREAFSRKRREAIRVLEKGIELAFENATTATKMGLVNFRKTAQK